MIPSELESLIKQSLDEFYKRRLNKLSTLRLKDTLQKKNPYLFRAIGVQEAYEIVTGILQAYMSSSDETIFGDAFFEPIVKLAGAGRVSPSEGVDVVIETDTVYKAIAVKSGPNIFNASQSKRQNQEFLALRSRLHKIQKQFDAVLGSCYGRKNVASNSSRIYRISAGQAFWEELTGEADFYLQIIRLMGDFPQTHKVEFEKEWSKAINRFELEFLLNFGTSDGGIDWEKLLLFNSGKAKPIWRSTIEIE